MAAPQHESSRPHRASPGGDARVRVGEASEPTASPDDQFTVFESNTSASHRLLRTRRHPCSNPTSRPSWSWRARSRRQARRSRAGNSRPPRCSGCHRWPSGADTGHATVDRDFHAVPRRLRRNGRVTGNRPGTRERSACSRRPTSGSACTPTALGRCCRPSRRRSARGRSRPPVTLLAERAHSCSCWPYRTTFIRHADELDLGGWCCRNLRNWRCR